MFVAGAVFTLLMAVWEHISAFLTDGQAQSLPPVLQFEAADELRQLRRVSVPIDVHHINETIAQHVKLLQDCLDDFVARNGVGRAIAAPQIGWPARAVALRLDNGTNIALLNPEIVEKSVDDTATLWDDCFSLKRAQMFVRVRRYRRVKVHFYTVDGKFHQWHVNAKGDDFALSELLQHELDHLDGVLAIDRVEPLSNDAQKSIISRSEYEKQRDLFNSLVDFKR